MKDLRPIRGKFHIASLIAEGEHECQDFKYKISDSLKIARTVSAFSNNKGGRLLLGVRDNGSIAGVSNEEDIFLVEQAAQMYCNPEVSVNFTAYRATDEGHIVIKAEIPAIEARPVRCREADGRWRAYFRVKDENILASPLMVKAWKLQSEGNNGNLLFNEQASRVVAVVEREGVISSKQLARSMLMSKQTMESLVVGLVSAGILDFRLVSGEFLLTLKGE